MSIAGPNPAWQVTPAAGYQLNSVAISADGATVLTGTSIESQSSDDFGVYCYAIDAGSTGRLLWSDPLGRTAYDGVFWVALSADGQWAAAGGSYGTGAGGFIRLYGVAAGASSRQEFATTGRVNEIEVSADGSVVVACYADRLDCYVRTGTQYALAASQTFAGSYASSCGLAPDGRVMVVGGEIQAQASAGPQSTSSPGFVAVLGWDGSALTVLSNLSTAQGVLRVVISGSFVAASTFGGTVSLWSPAIGPVWQLEWTVSPTPALARIYALAIAQTDTTVWVGGGGNGTGSAHGHGGMFVIQSVPSAQGMRFTPTQLWSATTTYPPNPASYFDAGVNYLTAADGEPTGSSETSGQFYLFEARTGTLAWTGESSLMNWGMQINAAGTACVGGSDNGTLYYWGAPSTA